MNYSLRRFFLLFAILLPLFSQELRSQDIEVPELVGITLEEARRILHEARLSMVGMPQENSEHQPGIVTSQEPVPGTRLKRGEFVRLTVAISPEVITVPEVVGLSLEEVRGLFQEARLQLIVTEEPRQDYPTGKVFEQRPPPGSKLSGGSAIYLTVAIAPETATVSNLVGLRLLDAQLMLQKIGLSTIVNTVTSAAYEAGTVFEQNLAPEAEVAVGTPVYLKVATAPEKVDVIETSNRPLEESQAMLQDKGLQPVINRVTTTDHAPGTVIEQSLTPGSQIAVGTPIYLKVATSPETVVVPELEGQSFLKARELLQETQLSMIVQTEITNVYPAGTIIGQNLPSGEKSPAGTPLYVKVATAPQTVTVPQIASQSLEEAQSAIEATDLPIAFTFETTTTYEPGTIIEQSLTAGNQAQAGTPIYLKVATGANTQNVPNLTGQNIGEANAILRKLRLPTLVSTVMTTSYRAGSILEQNPTPGSNIPQGTPVYLKVATGSDSLALPDLTGYRIEETQAILQQAELPMILMPETTKDAQPGTVLKQLSANDSEIFAGTPVFLKIAIAPGQVEVPDITKIPLGQAWDTLSAASLSMVVNTEINTTEIPGTVLEQDPLPGSRVPGGSPLYLKVALGQESTTISTLTGRTFGDAWSIIRAANLQMILMLEVSTEHEPGTLFRQIPAPTEPLPVGSPVYLKMSLGAEFVEILQLENRSLEEARTVARELGLPLIVIPEMTTEYQPGTVMGQSLAAGTRVATGTPLYVRVATASNIVVVDTLVNRSLEEARTIIQESGLQLVVVDTFTTDYEPGRILTQNPQPGTEISLGDNIYLTIATDKTGAELPEELPLAPNKTGDIAATPGDETTGIYSRFEESIRVAIRDKTLTPGLTILFGFLLLLLVLLIVLIRKRKKKEVKVGKQSEKDHTYKKADGETAYGDGQVDFETDPDTGKQSALVKGVSKESGEDKDGTGEAEASPPEDGMPGIQELCLEISKLLETKQFSTFSELAKALGFSIKLIPVTDPGKQTIRVADSLIDREKEFQPAGVVIEEAQVTEQVHPEQTADLEALIAQISDILNASKITSFDQLAKELSFKIDLERVSDPGKQSIYVKGSILLQDDLTRIKGINTEIVEALRSAEIVTFAQLASPDVDHLQEILDEAGFVDENPSNWPEQASLAAAGEWKALEAFQERIEEESVGAEASPSVDSTEPVEIDEAAARISNLLNTSEITSFDELTKALSFKIGLERISDPGKQSVHVEGSILLRDDLTRISGVNPGIVEVLQQAGIVAFAQLASSDVAHLQEVLREAGFIAQNPAAWPEQARLAAAGEWKALEAFQEGAKGEEEIEKPIEAETSPLVDSTETVDIDEATARISDLLSTSEIASFDQLTKALGFKIGLERVSDPGKQSVHVEGSILQKTKDG